MQAVFLIALREYLEVFLIVGVFLGISRKLNLKREKEILLASIIGVVISFLLPIGTFMLGDKASVFLTEKNAELLEGYLMIFSGFFIAYVVFSLHKFFVLSRSKAIIDAHQKMQQNVFDFSIFMTIIFFILREGLEIALFTATTSLFSEFMDNLIGLFLGFALSAVFGLLTFVSYIKFPISKIFKATEYMIILLGAAFVKNGITELLEVYMDLNLKNVLPLKLAFLPNKETLIGGMLKTMTGIEQNFSFSKLAIMIIYIGVVYFLLMKKKSAPAKI
jgi:high-affinity iron transporter